MKPGWRIRIISQPYKPIRAPPFRDHSAFLLRCRGSNQFCSTQEAENGEIFGQVSLKFGEALDSKSNERVRLCSRMGHLSI